MAGNEREWEGKVALITGATSGIGLGIAEAFLEVGMRVALGYRSETHLAEAMRKLAFAGDRVLPTRIEVSDRLGFSQAVDEVLGALGKINILVNNAGLQDPTPLSSMSYEQWDRLMDANVDGVFNGVHEVLPHILRAGERGHVLTTSSIMGLFTTGGGYGAYCASKFAVTAMMETLSAELAGTPVGVTILCPGLVRSNLEPFLKDFAAAADPLDIGRLALHAMQRNDLYLLTHPEHIPLIQARTDLVVRSQPDGLEITDAQREMALRQLSHSIYSTDGGDR